MEKARIYELAKELNTTSKRLIEKLAEINVNVKNHMSLLEPHELDALYKHIGVIKHEDKKADEDKKAVPDNAHAAERKKEAKKDSKSAPRIIRTTEIILDSKVEAGSAEPANNYSKKSSRNAGKSNYKNEYVKTESSSSGLRPGFVHDIKPETKNKHGDKGNRVAEPPNITAKAPQAGKDDILNINQNTKNEDVKKEDKTVADNTIQFESNLINSNEATDTSKSNISEAAHGGAEPKNIGNSESAPVVAQNRAQAGSDKDIKKADNKASEKSPDGSTSHRPEKSRMQYDNGHQNHQNSGSKPDRPQGQYNNQRTDRPQGQYSNQRTDRPQGQYSNQRTDRPQGQYNNQRTDRPQGQYNNQRTDRPQG
ncbi:translation initiation factor IF-2, partial [Ruminiclostridium sufflavum DSM 19573]